MTCCICEQERGSGKKCKSCGVPRGFVLANPQPDIGTCVFYNPRYPIPQVINGKLYVYAQSVTE